MKRRITLSIALALSVVLLSLMSSDRAVRADTPQRLTFDTGIVTLGENQILRVTTAGGSSNELQVRFRDVQYAPDGCNADGVCKHTVSSQTTSDPVTLMPGEGASFDFRRCMSPICGGVRGMVLSNSRTVRVNALIIDDTTGETVSLLGTTYGGDGPS